MRAGIEILSTADRKQWLNHRRHDVTASVAGALLGVHPYVTAYALWALKSDKLDEDPEETPSMQRGRLLEPVAIELLGELRPAWDLTAPHAYLRDPKIRLGATPDLYVADRERGFGTVQIKSVEPGVFHRTWRNADTREIEPPLWIVIQSLVEAHLAGARWSAIAALVVGHGLDLEIVDVPMHEPVIEKVRTATADFWRSVARDEPPPIDFAADADTIARIYEQDDGTELDLSHDPHFSALVNRRLALAAARKAADDSLKIANAEILATLGTASSARFAGGRVSAKTVNRKAYTVEASHYRALRITTARKDMPA